MSILRPLAAALPLTLALAAGPAMAQGTPVLATTEQIVTLCGADPATPKGAADLGFCQGYIVGVYHFTEELARGPKGKRTICVPEPRPDMPTAVAAFRAWAAANPLYLSTPPVEGVLRWASSAYPCG